MECDDHSNPLDELPVCGSGAEIAFAEIKKRDAWNEKRQTREQHDGNQQRLRLSSDVVEKQLHELDDVQHVQRDETLQKNEKSAKFF